MPFFSVIIPCYNREKFIDKTVLSVLNQSFDDFEVIIVDDGSTDNTRQIIEKKFGHRNNIKYFFTENNERGAARNFGVQRANGNFVVLLDSDDLMLSHYLKSLYDAISERSEVNFFACGYSIFFGDQKRDSSLVYLKEGLYNYKLLLKGNLFASNVCFRRKQVNFYPFLDDRKYSSAEDWVFLMENLIENSIYYINKECVVMNDHTERSMGNDEKVIEARLNAMQYLLKKNFFTVKERKVMLGFTFLFCSIHYNLMNKSKEAFRYYFRHLRLNGMSFSQILFGLKLISDWGDVKRCFPHNMRKKFRKMFLKNAICF